MPINTGSLGEQENILFIDFGFGDILMTKGRDEDSLYQNQLLFSKGKVRNIGEESNDHEGLTSDHIPNLKMVMRFANAESITALIHSLCELQKEVFLLNSEQDVKGSDTTMLNSSTEADKPLQNSPVKEDWKERVMKILDENKQAMISAKEADMDVQEIFETDNIYDAMIETYEDLETIISSLK